jgi:hypothetical protein
MIKRDGGDIMKYGDDQCICCGALRVTKSDKCAECFVRLCEIRLIEIERLEKEKIVLHDKLQQAVRLSERLLDHISSEAVYTSELRLELWKAKGIIKGG